MVVIVAFLEIVVQGAPLKLPRVQVRVREDVPRWVFVHKWWKIEEKSLTMFAKSYSQ